MRQVIRLSSAELGAERLPGADDGVHFASALVRAIVAEFSSPGDVVLDPFAGFGTTLAVAAEMGRGVVGVELLPDRVALIRSRVPAGVRVIEGDARRLDEYGIGPVSLCLTSPPYMTATGHPQNPLTGYRTFDGDYATYLAELADVFRGVARLLCPGGHLAVNAANIWSDGVVTPLAWDIARVVGQVLPFHGEIYLDWEPPLDYLTGDYCLIFREP